MQTHERSVRGHPTIAAQTKAAQAKATTVGSTPARAAEAEVAPTVAQTLQTPAVASATAAAQQTAIQQYDRENEPSGAVEAVLQNIPIDAAAATTTAITAAPLPERTPLAETVQVRPMVGASAWLSACFVFQGCLELELHTST